MSKGYELFICALVLLGTFLVSANGTCIPGQVQNIQLLPNFTLTWNAALNPNNCKITKYYVNIFDTVDESDLQYEVANTLSLDVSFLDSCTYYGFEVHAFTNESDLGPSYREFAKTSLPAEANLNISDLNTVTVSQASIQIDWKLGSPKLDKCISYYRVSYWDETNHTTTTYVNTKQFLVSGNIPACMNYTFQVSAIITDSNLQGPIFQLSNVAFTEVPTEPNLFSVLTTNSSAQMVWQLEPYAANRCNMLYLNATTAGVPANDSYITVPITDNESRPNVILNITGLQPNTNYLSEVSVVNIGGASNNVSVTFQTNK
ncbi:uncharacterized protein LOC126739851 [Anthonomus grandis grandis]|uniref:uncharacterized protein LOC126739851 n=1 Tax=Anthonomus grandis grandis TaxID=2921223 RepID=UPI002165D35B|nr:uncharacterized protein LOC126739851 [Anthonomus grandis grandis]